MDLEIRNRASAREAERIRRIQDVETRKQRFIHELDEIEWSIVENDKWFIDVKSGACIAEENDHQQHRKIAEKLFFRRKKIVEDLLPASDRDIGSVLKKIDLEEQQEDCAQQLDIERLLEPIRERKEKAVAQRKFAKRRAQKKAKEEAEYHARIEYEALLTRIRKSRLAEEQKRQNELRKRTIAEVRTRAAEREIPYLVHFTALDNLESISKHGLLSINALRGKRFVRTDDLRTDGWLDWISVSISFPNYKMFVSKRGHLRNVSGWVVIVINPEVLWELECKYLLTNAASSEVRMYRGEHWSSSAAFEEMFSQEEYRDSIPDYYTTDPQAEVMIRNRIPRSMISRIIVQNPQQVPAARTFTELPVEADMSFFQWRSDYKSWRKSRLLPQKRTAKVRFID